MRYTVERCRDKSYPRHYGYTIRDNRPHIQTHEDVEGVGFVPITPRVCHFCGWYRYKSDAESRAAVLNR